MPVRVRELAGVNDCSVDVLGVRSGRERLNRLSTFEVGWINGDEDQRETRARTFTLRVLSLLRATVFNVRIVHYSTVALEEIPEGLIGPNSVPKCGILQQEVNISS